MYQGRIPHSKDCAFSHCCVAKQSAFESLAAQTDDPSLVYLGQQFQYVSEFHIATPPLFTDFNDTDIDGQAPTTPTVGHEDANSGDANDGGTNNNDDTDSDGYNTLPDLEYGYHTQPPPTDNDGYDTPPDLEYGYDGFLTPASLWDSD